MNTIKVVRDLVSGNAEITFTCDAGIVELIKSINHKSRTYIPDTKTWIVAPEAIDDLLWIFQQAGHRVITSVTGKPGNSSNWALQLFAAVGTDRTDAVHRALTKILHPDTSSGDAELQKQPNAARDVYHSERGANCHA